MSKPTIRTRTSAIVSITLEVRTGVWGAECPLSQVYRQASEEAAGAIRRLIKGDQTMRLVRIDSIKSITTDAEASHD